MTRPLLLLATQRLEERIAERIGVNPLKLMDQRARSG